MFPTRQASAPRHSLQGTVHNSTNAVQCTKTMQGQNTCTMSHVVVGICDDIVCLVGDIVVNVCIAGKAQRVLSTPDNQATIDKWSSMNNLAQLRW